MEEASLNRVEDASKKFLLSRTVRDLLSRAYVDERGTGATVSIASFLATALRTGASSTATLALREIFGADQSAFPGLAPSDPKQPPRVDTWVSDGLWQVLGSAQDVRLQTRGNDQFVGLRYVLLEIITARSGPAHEEIAALFSSAGPGQQNAAEVIARYCMENHEATELFSAWESILTERDVSDALEAWTGAKDIADNRGAVGPSGAKIVRGASDVSGATFVAPGEQERGGGLRERDRSVAFLQPDDPWSEKATPRKDVKKEADAFADMIVAKDFEPPLAVGVFGDWGSGKSHFMRLLYESVANNTDRFNRDRAVGDITFCQNVVQIRFNAWHYAEVNLWPSLVDHIFTSLNQWNAATGPTAPADALFGKLTTARRLTIEAAIALVESRRQTRAAAARLSTAEAALRAKQAALEADPRVYAIAAFDEVAGKSDAKARLQDAAEKLGLGDLAANAEALQVATAALNSETERFALLKTGISRQMTSVGVIAVVAGATVLLPIILNYLAIQFEKPALELSATIAGFVAPIGTALGFATKTANDALATVRSYRDRFDLAVEKRTEEARAAVEESMVALATAEADVAVAKVGLDMAAQSASQAVIDYRSETGRDRVLRFVSERVADGGYARHLSFIATIRKDFEELSRLLVQARKPEPGVDQAYEAHKKTIDDLVDKAAAEGLLETDEEQKLRDTAVPPTDDQKVYERIILYVDDLDRCQPEQVVAVLQAIHLLLAFPLFVVFVAVDVRWLRHALDNRYPNLKHKAGATTSDYLEKIFQIPYWVRPFDATVTRSILQSRMGSLDQSPQGASPRPSPEGKVIATAQVGEIQATVGAQGGGPVTEPDTSSDTLTVGEPVAAPVVDPNLRRLTLSVQERDCVAALADVLDGLPRRTLRFINSYWIIKAGLGDTEQDDLESTAYRAVLSLLAIAIELEDDYPKLVAGLRTATPAQDLAAAVDGIGFSRPKSKSHVLACFNASGGPLLDQLQNYAPLVLRYSFHGGLALD